MVEIVLSFQVKIHIFILHKSIINQCQGPYLRPCTVCLVCKGVGWLKPLQSHCPIIQALLVTQSQPTPSTTAFWDFWAFCAFRTCLPSVDRNYFPKVISQYPASSMRPSGGLSTWWLRLNIHHTLKYIQNNLKYIQHTLKYIHHTLKYIQNTMKQIDWDQMKKLVSTCQCSMPFSWISIHYQ